VRVAIVASPYKQIPPVGYGGTEWVIHYLIKGLKEAGHEPILFASRDSKVDCELIPIISKATFFPKRTQDLPIFRQRMKQIDKRTAKKLRALLPDIDVIHAHPTDFDMKPFADFPNVTTLHGPITFENMSYYVERKHLNYISISHNQQQAFPDLNYLGVVYNGEDPERFPFVKSPQNYLCFLGRFDEDKSPHLAIELAINLGMKIKLAGKTDFQGYRYFRSKVQPYFKHPLVEYLGELDFEDKVKLISRAKCNLHPTYFREPFGLTVLEAAYCGTPTLAISRGAMPELIENDKSGMLVEDFIEGFHSIQKCFDMDREYIAKRARRKFNYKNMTKGYIRAYRRAIRQARQKN
jgi:glycosyltransferase involved in cell wall biosynthesis